MNLSNLVGFFEQDVEWGHAQDEGQLLSMFLIIEVELSHQLIERVVWKLTAMNLVKYHNVEIAHFEVCVQQALVKDFGQK